MNRIDTESTRIVEVVPAKQQCFSRKDACGFLGVTDSTFGRILEEGNLPTGFTLKDGGRPYWRRASLENFLDKRANRTLKC